MNIKSIVDFHKQAPRNATHVLKRGDKYEYANLNGSYYDSCENATRDDMLRNPSSANNDFFFIVQDGEWEVHLELCSCR